MCMLFHGGHCPVRHGGALGAGGFLTTPHTSCPHAFVSGPGFWVAAATGMSLNTLLNLNLTSGYPPTPTFYGHLPLVTPSIISLGGPCQLVSALASVLVMRFPQQGKSWKCDTFMYPSIHLWRNTYWALVTSWAQCPQNLCVFCQTPH